MNKKNHYWDKMKTFYLRNEQLYLYGKNELFSIFGNYFYSLNYYFF